MSKVVASIGGFKHEGLSANIKSLGYELMQIKIEGVKPKTWFKRVKELKEVFDEDNLAATILYIHTSLLLQASRPDYQTAFIEMLELAAKSKAIIFIFQDNLNGIFAMRNGDTREPMTIQELEEAHNNLGDYAYYFSYDRIANAISRLEEYEARKPEVDEFIKRIYETGIEVVPFYIRSDVTIRLQEFLSDIENKVFLKLYVPSDRIQADQFKSLLSVLERYMKQVERQDFSIDTKKSDKGVIYIFRSDTNLSNLNNLNDALARFDAFMKMCGDYPEKAQEFLKLQGLSDYDSALYVEKYSRDYKRLVLESRHEFERKSLLLKQRFEMDILDQNEKSMLSWSSEGISGLISSLSTGNNVAVNIENMNIINSSKIYNEVDKIINGSIIYNDNDKLLLEIFGRYADGLESVQCKSDLDQLKDITVTELNRQNAKQRLVGFLHKAARKAGEVAENIAVGALSLYLESLLKGGS